MRRGSQCKGDASLFASSSYVQLALRKQHPDLTIKLIPGIPAVCAAAAASAAMAIDWPLALQQDGVLIRPCPDHESDLEGLLESAESNSMVLALIKLGQRWPWVRACLETLCCKGPATNRGVRLKPLSRLELETSPLPRECSTAELQGLVERWAGLDLNQRRRSQRIYSPPPLTTRAPTLTT